MTSTATPVIVTVISGVDINADTGESIRDLTLDPTRDYQPLGRPPGPPNGTPYAADARKPPHRHKRSPGTPVSDVPGLHTRSRLGAASGIRTPDLLITSELLYP